MKTRKFIVPVIFFLFFSAFFLKNADAGVFDTTNFINLNYPLQYTQSDVYSASNMITYSNQIEAVYASSSGIKDLVLTNVSGGFSPQTYSVSSDVISSYDNGYSLIQNSSDLHLFYCNGTNIKHYYALKGNHIWSLVETLGSCTYGTVSYIFDKNDQSTIYGTYTAQIVAPVFPSITITYCEKTSSWNCDGGTLYQTQSNTFYLSQSLQTNNRFFTYHDGFNIAGRGDRNLDEISTIVSRNAGDMDLADNGRHIRGSAIGFSEIDAEYYAVMHCQDTYGVICNGGSALPELYELYYAFDTSDSLGINCTLTAGSNIYWCGGTIPYSSGSLSIQAYPNAFIHVPMKLDNLGNLHLLYSANNNSLVHFFQNNSKSSWIFDKIINITEEDRLRDFVIYGNGIMVMQTGTSSTNLNFWYNGASVFPPTPSPSPPPSPNIPTAISDNSLMGLMCNGGVWLTGTTYEGGCVVASLFILAVFLSVVGWLFKYIELEFEQKIPDKYLVSGLISLALIITFAIIGIADLVTTILGFFMITAILIAYYERSSEKK